MRKSNHSFLPLIFIVLSFSTSSVFACAGNGETFNVRENTSDCINVGRGHKIVHCIVSNLHQNSTLLISHAGFIPNSNYSIPRWALHINHNMQRITFSGVGVSDNSLIHFHYYGPWDPNYNYDLTCRW